MTIEELIKARNELWNKAKAFVESHRDKDGLMSEEDAKTYDEMEQKIKAYNTEIDRLQKMKEIEDKLAEPTSKPLVSKPDTQENEKTGRASDEYKKAMITALRTNFKQISNVLQEGTDADGGYLVPEEMDNRLIEKLSENNIMRKLGTTIQTSGEHKINVAASKPTAAWIDEGAALTFGDATFSQILLDAHKLHVAVKVTEELLYDSAFDLVGYITKMFGEAIADKEEDAFLNGDGNGKPTGIFAATGGGTAFKTLTAALKADDLIELIYALKRPYRKNAAVIINDSVITSIRKLKDTTGTYIWQPSYQSGEPDRLLGYPVYTSAYAPANAVAFGDFSYYNIGDRGTRSFAELRELFAGNGQTGFVAKERVDGKLILPEAVQILTLSTTV